MSILAKPTPASTPRTKLAGQIAILYAAILVLFAVAQLFTFDSFLVLLTDFHLPFGIQGAYFIGAFIVVLEVFALPFLLRMPLSKAFRWVSLGAGILAALTWLKLTLWLEITRPTVDAVGFLGTVPVTPGVWAVALSVALVVMAIWSIWGLWPGKRR